MSVGVMALMGAVVVAMASSSAVAGNSRPVSGRVASANQRVSTVAMLDTDGSLAVNAPAITATGGSEASGEVVVRLYPQAVVDGDAVTLADVAEIQGDAGQLMASWVVANAPQPGGSSVVELDRIQVALTARRANLSSWIFRGASRCNVSRPMPSKPAANVGGSATPLTNPVGNHVYANTLEGAIREYLATRLSSLGGEPVIEFGHTHNKLLSLSRKTYKLDIACRNDRLTGLVPLEVTISENGTIKQVVQIVAEVQLKKSVIVAARPINQGEILRESDLTTKERIYENVDKIGLTDAAPLIGQRAKRFIDRGVELSARDIEPMPLVNRNDLVTVWASRGGVRIKGAAKAMQPGGFGQRITVKNEASRELFNVVITGPQTVELDDGVRHTEVRPVAELGSR